MLFPPQIQVVAFTMQDAISIIYGLSLNLCFLVLENDKLFFLSCFKKNTCDSDAFIFGYLPLACMFL